MPKIEFFLDVLVIVLFLLADLIFLLNRRKYRSRAPEWMTKKTVQIFAFMVMILAFVYFFIF